LKIGFIGFGEVNSTLLKNFLQGDFEILTSVKDRSEKTKTLLKTTPDINLLKSFEDVASSSDLLISSTTPYSALSVAKRYGVLTNGIFLDLNNISPNITLKIKNIIENTNVNRNNNKNNYNKNNDINNISFVKGAIIGKITSNDSIIYLSGEKAKKLAFLKNYGINIKIISENVEEVSFLKMLRSIYTKGTTAILYEVFNISEELGLTKELFETLSITEGENFGFQSKSRIKSLLESHKRKFEEMDEILEFLKNYYNCSNNCSNNCSDNYNNNYTKNYNKNKNFEFNSKMIKATKEKFEEMNK
jgi:3-hydroxyisobutyrate dehydrogenase-like beta-hydroxyacid dehydrogenase